MTDRRGQAYTLEGMFSAIVVLTALLYGLQVVDVGPWTSEAASETSSLETRAQDTLDIAASEGSLSNVTRCYGVNPESTGGYVFSGQMAGPDATTFERLLNTTFDERNRNYNVYLYYLDEETGQKERELVSMNRTAADSGVVAPTDSSVVASRTVVLYDDMSTRFGSDPKCGQQGATLKEYSNKYDWYIEDITPNSPVFNVVEVRVVVW